MDISTTTDRQIAQSAFFSRVFTWMFAGLTITAAMAWFVAGNASLQNAIFGNPGVFLGIIIAQFVEVIAFSFLVRRISAAGAALLFIAYSLTFSSQ